MCSHKNLNRTLVNDTIDIHLKPNVKLHNLFIKTTVYVKNNNLRYVPRYIINNTVDICAAMAGDMTNPLAILYKDYLSKTSNFFHSCPLSVCSKTKKKIKIPMN